MYLIIFGAGASYGSDITETPSLTKDLFDRLSLFNPNGWGKISGELADLFHQDFESAMKKVNTHSLPPIQRVMAAYFFNFLPKESNLYFRLAEKIKNNHWNGKFVTFNYDRLLEISLSKAGLRPVVGSEANSDNEIEMCLPHGCCHIFCESVRGGAKNVSMSGINIRTSGKIKIISNPDIFNSRIKNDAFPPVMSYFIPSKYTTSGVNFIEGQRKRYTEFVSNSDLIAIVGLMLREHDEHIWDPLKSTSARIIYMSGKSSGDKFKKWIEKYRSDNKDIILPYYFFEGFEKLCNIMGL